MLRRIKKGLGFVIFTLAEVRPFYTALKLIVGKTLQKLSKTQFRDLSFELVHNGVKSNVTVNDMEQYTYIFNIFYNELFKVSCDLGINPTIIDGGANIGGTSLYYASKFPNAVIFAFEPSESNAALLRKNAAGIRNIKIEQKALWDESKNLTFNVSECSRYHSAFKRSECGGVVEVRAVCLRDWIEENKLSKIDVLKLNVEGAELKAIRGLGDKIAEVRVIVGEFHPEFVDKEELTEELRRNGFKIIRFERTGKTVSIFESHNLRYAC